MDDNIYETRRTSGLSAEAKAHLKALIEETTPDLPEETSIVGRFRQKPVEVNAAHWDGTAEEAEQIIKWLQALGVQATYKPKEIHDNYVTGTFDGGPYTVDAHIRMSLQGVLLIVCVGDHIVHNEYGSVTVYTEEEFAETYEAVGRLPLDPWPLAYPDGSRARYFEGGVADHLTLDGTNHEHGEIGRGLEFAPRLGFETNRTRYRGVS